MTDTPPPATLMTEAEADYLRQLDRMALRERLVLVALPEVARLSAQGATGPLRMEDYQIEILADRTVKLADALLRRMEGDA